MNHRSLDIKNTQDCTNSVFEYTRLILTPEELSQRNKVLLKFLALHAPKKLVLFLLMGVSSSLKKHSLGVILNIAVCTWIIALQCKLMKIDSKLSTNILRDGKIPVVLELGFAITVWAESLARFINFNSVSPINILDGELGFNFQNSLFLFWLIWVCSLLVYGIAIIFDSWVLNRKTDKQTKFIQAILHN